MIGGFPIMFNYEKLEQAIIASGKTRTFLCQKLGRPPYYLRDVIRQKNRIPEEYQKILADECGVSVEYLNDSSPDIAESLNILDGISESSLVHNIKLLCKFNGITFKDFEIGSGVGRGTAAKWDYSSPSIEKVIKAARFFGVSVSFLIGEENNKTASPVADGLSEYDIKALAWFHSLSPEKRKAILSLADGPEELAELPDRE